MTDSQQDTFDSRAAYQLAIDRVLSAAKKELCIFDSNIGDLEFDSRARANALAAVSYTHLTLPTRDLG